MCSGNMLASLVKRGDRHSVDVPAIAYRADGSSFGVRVRNMSYNGCLLTADDQVDIGEKLSLALPSMGEIRAQVRWASTDGKAGAQFVVEEMIAKMRRF